MWPRRIDVIALFLWMESHPVVTAWRDQRYLCHPASGLILLTRGEGARRLRHAALLICT